MQTWAQEKIGKPRGTQSTAKPGFCQKRHYKDRWREGKSQNSENSQKSETFKIKTRFIKAVLSAIMQTRV